jgi:hypothetical protein
MNTNSIPQVVDCKVNSLAFAYDILNFDSEKDEEFFCEFMKFLCNPKNSFALNKLLKMEI